MAALQEEQEENVDDFVCLGRWQNSVAAVAFMSLPIHVYIKGPSDLIDPNVEEGAWRKKWDLSPS